MSLPKGRIDKTLLQWATPKQAEKINAVNEFGSIAAASRATGVDASAISRSITSVELKAAMAGYSPQHDMTHQVPAGFKVKGVSTYYDESGKPRGQWVKSATDAEETKRLLEEAFQAMAEDLPKMAKSKPPKVTLKELCNLYVMTDCHVGMLSWHKESGADWDLKIAERVLTGCFEQMVVSSPAAGVGVVAQLGDWLHSDGILPVTPTSHNILDQDGRFSKIVQASVRILRRLVDFALQKHEKVIVLMAEGNHDMSSSIWLRTMFNALYEKEPRVDVIDSEMPYYVYQHGETMLSFHHGHLKKLDQLPLLFAAQFPKIWGNTTKRYCHTGHRHHVEEKEHSGMTVVQHPTLAARDAYASRGGWIAERQVSAITYHSTHGQVAKITVTPEMLDDLTITK
jgi:hypothetical protein